MGSNTLQKFEVWRGEKSGRLYFVLRLFGLATETFWFERLTFWFWRFIRRGHTKIVRSYTKIVWKKFPWQCFARFMLGMKISYREGWEQGFPARVWVLYRNWLYWEKTSKKFGRAKLDEHARGIEDLYGGMMAMSGLYGVSIGAGYWRG